MNNSNICVIYSSYNNYEMLEKEVLKRSFLNGQLIINVDDFSSPESIEYGINICKKNNIHFLKNKKKGVQNAIQTAIDWLEENNFNKSWLLIMQHDIFPTEKNFYTKLNKLVQKKSLKKVGILGFNIIDGEGEFSKNSLKKYNKGEKPDGYLGVPFLSDTKKEYERVSKRSYLVFLAIQFLNNTILKKNYFIKKLNFKYQSYSNSRRNFCPLCFKNFYAVAKKFPSLFTIELPVWAGIAININAWKENIIPCDELQFMLWGPDIAMQFLSKNYHCAVTKDLYLHNDQVCKEKYGFNKSSPAVSHEKSKKQLNENGNYDLIFKKRWGFLFIDVKNGLSKVIKRYKNTLVEKYFLHDFRNGPLEKLE